MWLLALLIGYLTATLAGAVVLGRFLAAAESDAGDPKERGVS